MFKIISILLSALSLQAVLSFNDYYEDYDNNWKGGYVRSNKPGIARHIMHPDNWPKVRTRGEQLILEPRPLPIKGQYKEKEDPGLSGEDEKLPVLSNEPYFNLYTDSNQEQPDELPSHDQESKAGNNKKVKAENFRSSRSNNRYRKSSRGAPSGKRYGNSYGYNGAHDNFGDDNFYNTMQGDSRGQGRNVLFGNGRNNVG